ncbi:MAG: M20/M25/M40 family metallo-hydrolase, partial [Paracoccaceae bacterium]
KGVGSHAAMPQSAKDTVVIASALVGQLQTIVSRNVPPLESCVVSVTQIHAGAAYNVVPETAKLCGTIRYFKDEVYEIARSRMEALCKGMAEAYGVEIKLDARNIFDVLHNDSELSDAYLEAAADIVGAENVSSDAAPATGSEDFADMLKIVPGSYCRLGHTGTIGLHNPSFVLGQEILPVGASIMARIVERRLPLN